MKYRKRPVEIEAVQWTSRNVAEMAKFMGGELRVNHLHELIIETLEGDMRASPYDWIIRGVRGEYYPCKPEIFAETYEVVDAID